jgi:hypothetical protein
MGADEEIGDWEYMVFKRKLSVPIGLFVKIVSLDTRQFFQ